jgi:hypothetical protein
MNEQRDTSGRSFLLSYIELQKNELLSMQRQLERYADDFRYLLAAGDVRTPSPSSQTMTWNNVCRNSIEFVNAVGDHCLQVARLLGQSEKYCRNLSEAAHAILTIQHGARPMHEDRISVLALEISLYKSKWFNGKGMPFGVEGQQIPLASRIFNLAEYAASLTEASLANEKHTPLTRQELAELLHPIRGEIFDPSVIDALLNLNNISADGRPV